MSTILAFNQQLRGRTTDSVLTSQQPKYEPIDKAEVAADVSAAVGVLASFAFPLALVLIAPKAYTTARSFLKKDREETQEPLLSLKTPFVLYETELAQPSA